MGLFLSTAIRALAVTAGVLCVASGFTGVVDWALALPATLPCVLFAELGGIVAHRIRSRREIESRVIHAEARFRYITTERSGERGGGTRAA